jgi:hypothetical protein
VTDIVLTLLYLFVSVESLCIQVFSLVRVRLARRGRVQRHLRRTVVCRVLAMSAYVVLSALNAFQHTLLSVPALAVFTATALMWQLNSLADVRLSKDPTVELSRLSVVSDLPNANLPSSEKPTV